MSYTKARKVLPAKLLQAVQKYIDGQCIYIPQKGAKKPWGALTQTKAVTANRNKQIFSSYISGIPVKTLSRRYFLSDKAIYKIIADIKYSK